MLANFPQEQVQRVHFQMDQITSWVSFDLIDLLPIIVSLQVIQAVFFGICVLTDLSSLLTRGSGNQEQERQLKKLISLRDWMLAVLAFPVGVVSMM